MSLSHLVHSVPSFVGRKDDLNLFAAYLQDMLAGRPRIMLIAGEAGVGKTKLLKECQKLAQNHKAAVYAGRCYEGQFLPYAPFAEALHGLVEPIPEVLTGHEKQDREILNRLLLRGPPDDARLVQAEQAEQERLRLFLAVSRIIVDLARRHPMLFVVDDLHWADPPSLELLAHLVFTATQTAEQYPLPLLILSAYRPEEDRPGFVRALDRLQREDICAALALTGLDEIDIHNLVNQMCLERPSSQLVATIRDISQGNPLFIQETLYHLEQQNALHVQDDDLVTTASAEQYRPPDHLTSLIRERIKGLTADCQRVLTLAAFLGEDFSFEVLEHVSGIDGDTLLEWLEEGLQQRFLSNIGLEFQFAHTLICHAFYNLPSVLRRQRLHGQIAEALEYLHAHNLDAAVLEIASHLVRAGSAAKTEKIIRYGRQAGDYAFAAFNWPLAAHYYTAVLTAAEPSPDAEPMDLGLLHYRTGFAHCSSGDFGLGHGHYDRAIEAYKTAGDLQGQAQALIRKMLRQAAVTFGTLSDLEPLENLLEEIGRQAPPLRGRIIATLSELYWSGRQGETAEVMARRALEIGEETGDAQLCSKASYDLALAQVMNLDIGASLDSYEQARTYAQQAQSRWLEGVALQRIATALVLLGRFADVDAVAAEAHTAAAETNNWGHYSLTLSALAATAVARGDFDGAEHAASECMILVGRYRFPFGGALALPALACARALRGLWHEAERALDMLVEPGVVFDRPRPSHQAVTAIYRRLIRQYAEGHETPAGEIGPLIRDTVDQEPLDVSFLPVYCALVELCTERAAQSAHIAELYERLTQVAERGILFSRGWVFLIPRVLGLAACAAHWWDRAEAHFQYAIAVSTAVGARPALGRSHLDYARMLILRRPDGSHQLAFGHAERARAIFNELGMSPFAQQSNQLIKVIQSYQQPPVDMYNQKPNNHGQNETQIILDIVRKDLYFLE